MSEVKAITQDEQERHREDLVAAACRLVGSDTTVRRIHVLTPNRPTYDELSCYQEWAHEHHVRLSVDGEGVITVRPEVGAED